MARKEEINKQALRYGEPEYLLQTPNILGTQGFIQGAKWADEHPEDGLVKIDDVRKFVREWLNTNFYEEKYWTLNPIYWGGEDVYLDELIDDLCNDMIENFRKAMEE